MTLHCGLSHRLDDAQKQVDAQSKQQDLSANTTEGGTFLTDNMGHAVSDDQNSLKVGERGPTLMEDFLFREKIHHFDHERIPERVVHARGAGAHGYFQLDKSLEQYTHAKVLTALAGEQEDGLTTCLMDVDSLCSHKTLGDLLFGLTRCCQTVSVELPAGRS